MTAAEDIHHYKPIFSINRTAWWVHTDRIRDNSATQIASAATNFTAELIKRLGEVEILTEMIHLMGYLR